MTDSQLLGAYLGTGRMDYFGELYGRYMPLVYGVCLRYLRNGADAEDAVIQIFEELAPKMERYTIVEYRTWIYGVAKNHCLQQLRKKQVAAPSDFPDHVMEFTEIVHLLSTEDDERRFAQLELCLEHLPAQQKESIRMFFMEEKSYADIAEATDREVKSVKSFIQNGKRNLKICMERQK